MCPGGLVNPGVFLVSGDMENAGIQFTTEREVRIAYLAILRAQWQVCVHLRKYYSVGII